MAETTLQQEAHSGEEGSPHGGRAVSFAAVAAVIVVGLSLMLGLALLLGRLLGNPPA
jgi:hypothetical protein